MYYVSNMLKRVIYVFIIFFLMLVACNKANKKLVLYTYPKDKLLSDSCGFINNYTTTYYPKDLLIGGKEISTGIDSIEILEFTNYLYLAQEPILYNFYLNKDIVRFLWVRSRRNSFVFNVSKQDHRYSIEVKEFTSELHFANMLIMNKAQFKLQSNVMTQAEYDSLYRINNPNLVFDKNVVKMNTEHPIKRKEWDDLISLIDSTSFWTTKFDNYYAEDGSYYIIEVHQKNRYWFTGAWSSNDDLLIIANYIKKLSGFDKYKTMD